MAGKADAKEEKGITAKKASDFSEWYTQTVIRSGFIDYTSVSGCIAFRPDSYFVWETLQKALDQRFKGIGISNAYFPMLIPEKHLNKEKEHVEGFNPEVAWVTHTGDSKLDERLAIRPTSETIIYDTIAKWIRSWRDLPLRLNQWCSVLRWEFKHPTPLLRSREFMWNEGHTAFATKEEAEEERAAVLKIYGDVLREYLALPGVVGEKTQSEKFAGAVASYSIEHLLPEGKAIQGPDTHDYGNNFSKAFEISFIDREGQKRYAYQNTFGFSTRELGAMVAVHGDDKGLVLPPKVARVQAVIVPIFKEDNKGKVLAAASRISAELAKSIRALLDDSDAYSPGWKFNQWEMRGVPIRIELGERDLSKDEATVVRRDTGKKESVPLAKLDKRVAELLDEINEGLYGRAKEFLDTHTFKVKDYDELKSIANSQKGIAQAPWCGSEACEKSIKEETGAKITNMPLDAQAHLKGKKCIYCGKEAKHMANFAKSY
ncbi:MAG: proline--tRNA ligase [Candidatus Micrarchaeota archaeon]|nr:proline--tRNA ligase [Candidatus Micrarchaeota archaeon]